MAQSISGKNILNPLARGPGPTEPEHMQYGDHSSSYWPEGWNYQRYSDATAEDILSLPDGELDKMQAGLREVLGEHGAAAMSKHNFERRLSGGATMLDAYSTSNPRDRRASVSSNGADVVTPSWLKQWRKRHEGQPWGFVGVRTGCYGGGGADQRWQQFRAQFQRILEVPFDWAVENGRSSGGGGGGGGGGSTTSGGGGEMASKARDMFEVRWIEDPALDGADVQILRGKFQELQSTLPPGFSQPVFLSATDQVVDAVLALTPDDLPTTASRRGRNPAPWVYAVAASPDRGVPDEHAESAWFRDVFKVAIEVLADELWWIVDSGTMPLRRITRGVKGEGVAADAGNDDLEDIWWSTAPSAERLKKLNGLVSMPSYCIATALAKASVILYLLNFTTTASPRAIRFVAYATLVLSILQCIMLAAGTMACAAGLRGLVDLFGTGIFNVPTCTKLGEIWVSTAMINSFTDLVILLLPVWIIRPLQVDKAKKIGVLAILMAGGFVFGVSVYRAYKSYEAFTMLSKDVSLWPLSDTAVWCVVELWAGIICACLPALRPFCRHMCGLVQERTTRTGGITSDASGRRSGLHFHKYTRQTAMELSATTNTAPHRPPSRESSRPIQGFVVGPPSPSVSGGSRIRSQDMERRRSISEHV
ncbi:hypothetical protein PspLS_11099 [Pyricularia sp. CBS 133598]|nr:hypothetical protein PspLS_11099 [Pyricularia sp. CBS 133598]